MPDDRDRQIAVATFDRNLVVTAGAGTGKTTLLVDRLAHCDLAQSRAVKVTEIVALTFTNKAADEMKLRLREAFTGISRASNSTTNRQATPRAQRLSAVEELIARYRLSKDEMDRRIRDALRNLERSDIGTIHGFAANLLRLYPIEAGVDPQFREDDGKRIRPSVRRAVGRWLGSRTGACEPARRRLARSARAVANSVK